MHRKPSTAPRRGPLQISIGTSLVSTWRQIHRTGVEAETGSRRQGAEPVCRHCQCRLMPRKLSGVQKEHTEHRTHVGGFDCRPSRTILKSRQQRTREKRCTRCDIHDPRTGVPIPRGYVALARLVSHDLWPA
jgi:hypothetical protein